jgi:hypothetical protein
MLVKAEALGFAVKGMESKVLEILIYHQDI